MRLRVAIVAALVALATIVPDAARAYTLLGYTWPQSSMLYYINPANMDVPTSARQTTNTNDGINVVMFRSASSGSALATTYSWFSGTRIIDADIVFWDAGFQFFTGSSGCSAGFFIEDVATHEFGHALGLGHSTVAGATMYPSISACSQQSRTLDADDITAVLSIYPPTGAPPTAPKGLRIVR